MKCIVFAGMSVILAGGSLAVAQEVAYRLVHQEPLGGADSAISPDGDFMAFSSRRSGNSDLWILEVETGKLRQITDSPARDYEPRWHPDSTHLVFVSDRGDRSTDIYTVDLKTLEVTEETSTVGIADYPSYSKDGKALVFTSGIFGRGGIREVWVKDLEIGETRQVTKGHTFVGSSSFSPDGKQITFHSYYDGYGSARSDVWTVDSQGGKATNISNTNDVWDYKPVWSFDGEWITFSSKRGTSNFNVFMMHPDGTGLRAVTNQDGPDFRWPNFTRDGRLAWHAIDPQSGHIMAVDVGTGEVRDLVTSRSFIDTLTPSPDGSRILYVDRFSINLLDATNPTAKPVRLARGRDPRWSSDGKNVTYVDTRDNKTYRVSATGGTPVAISRRSAVAEASHTTSAGGTLVTATDGALVLAGNNGSRKLADNGVDKTSPVWSPDGKYIIYCQSQPAMVKYYMTVKAAANL